MRAAEVRLHSFLTTALDEGEWPTSCPEERSPKEALKGRHSRSERFGKENHLLILPGGKDILSSEKVSS